MKLRTLGRTGFGVSALSLGTVELGVRYGLYHPGEREVPVPEEAGRILRRALGCGVNLLDTAPGYGASEALVGEALREFQGTIFVATKVTSPSSAAQVRRSVDQSLRRLGKDHLDLLQLHNATAKDFENGELVDALAQAKAEGRVRCLGASVYETEAALAALRCPAIDTIQVAYNLLDQRMAGEVFPAAARAGVGILVRSALLKGVLSDRRQALPIHLAPLREAAERAAAWAGRHGLSIAEAALRFCLSNPQVASVLIGVRDEPELEAALQAESAPLLEPSWLREAEALAIADAALVDPRRWGID